MTNGSWAVHLNKDKIALNVLYNLLYKNEMNSLAHNALYDAAITALCFSKMLINGYQFKMHTFSESYYEYVAPEKPQQPQLSRLNQNVLHPGNHFQGKTVLITGIFSNYSRVELKELLYNLGAQNQNSLSTKTDIVIIGSEPGPSKLSEINELQSKGYRIEVIFEQYLYKKIKEIDDMPIADNSLVN